MVVVVVGCKDCGSPDFSEDPNMQTYRKGWLCCFDEILSLISASVSPGVPIETL